MRQSQVITEKKARQSAFIENSFGKDILRYLADDTVTEIYVNDDGYLRLDTITGRKNTNIQLPDNMIKSICESISGYNDQIISEDKPLLGVELDTLYIRAQLMYPPVVKKPVFFLRKKPSIIFPLEKYLEDKVLSQTYYDCIIQLIKERKNVIVIGATGSGKTTFLNAVLKKLAEINGTHRLVILEDTPELQTSSDDVQHMLTSGNKETKITLQDLVFVSMRLSPDRIMVGEVRDSSAYDVLKAWNTGHAGGFCSLHADSTVDAFSRIELLVRESPQASDIETIKSLVGASVDAIISIQKQVTETGTFRKVDDIILVDHYDSEHHTYIYHHVKENHYETDFEKGKEQLLQRKVL